MEIPWTAQRGAVAYLRYGARAALTNPARALSP